jgi:hypothetical protein
MAAITGPRTTPATPVSSCAVVTTAMLGASVITNVPSEVSAAAASSRARL